MTLVLVELAPRPRVRRATGRTLLATGFGARAAAMLVYGWVARPFALRRTWAAGVAVIASVPLMIHAHAATHSRFLADDYCSAAAVASSGVWGMTKNQYLKWSGRYTAHALDGIATQSGPVTAAFLSPVVLAGMVVALAAYLARRRLRDLTPEVRVVPAAAWAMFVLATVFFITPDVLESFHWGQGMRTVLPAVLIGIVLAMLLSPAASSLEARCRRGGP